MSAFGALLLVAFALLARQESERSPVAVWKAGEGRVATGVFAAFVLLALSVTIGGFDGLLAVLALLLVLPGPLRPRPRLDSPGLLDSGVATVLAGAASAGVVAFVWGSLDPVARVHDEAAYLLQARLFAIGRWTGPPRPLPEFFEQMQVFVTPVLASKYPPGHSLVLVPGIWLGMPALMPLLLNAAAGSLVFAHARRLAGAAVALLTWILWVSAPGTLGYRASYLSQNTTTVLWLAVLWALSEWLSKGSRRWLVVLAACLGFGAITRPMTMFALSLPIAFVVLRGVVKSRRWRDLAIAAVAGGLFLALGVLWSVRTIGEWRTSPYREYSRIYFPYEWTGFGERPDPPLRPIPPGMDSFDRQFRRLHADHTVAAVPEILSGRLQRIFDDQWGGARRILAPFALVGSLVLTGPGFFALASVALLVVAHLFMAHFFSWTIYYLEAHPVLSFVTALGLCGVLASILAAAFPRRPRLSRRVGGLVLFAIAAALALGLAGDAAAAKEERGRDAAVFEDFRERVGLLPEERVIVFVRYGRTPDVHRKLVVNEPDIESAKAWVVHDRGERNAELMARAPGRKAYIYDEATRSLTRIEKK
jgi:hypothetical protein